MILGDKIDQALSIALSTTTLFVCSVVCYKWYKQALELVASKHKTAVGWLATGIFIGFFCSFIDNLYWGLAWEAAYNNRDYALSLFTYGTYTNIPFRQLGTALAGYCHLKAAMVYSGESMHMVHKGLVLSTAIGIWYVLL